jgi:hypothetical protein
MIFKYLPGQDDGTFTAGRFAQLRARWHINNEGWNSPVDYTTVKHRPLIAVIGDSYIDAMQVESGSDYPSLMRNALEGEYDVYSFGMSGAPMSQYLHMSRYVTERFDPDILIFNIVTNDFDESVHSIRPFIHLMTVDERDGSIVEIPPRVDRRHSEYSWTKRALKKSAIVRYLFLNLRMKQTVAALRSRKKEKYIDNTKADRIKANAAKIDDAVDYIVRTIREENPDRRIMFVIDAPRGAIYAGDPGSYGLSFLHDMMKEACSSHGVELLNMTDAMTEDYRKNGKKFNSEYDNHWDAYGHEVVAREVLKTLFEQ